MKSERKVLGATALTGALFISTTGLSWAESESIPLDQLGAVATKQVEGNGLSITAAENGARLSCAFQRLEGRATPGGLWLISTTKTAKDERFHLVATAVGHPKEVLRLAAVPLRGISPLHSQPVEVRADSRRLLRSEDALPEEGSVAVTEQLVRFIRPGLIEEYSVSVDGVRQDFVIMQRPVGSGDLCVELALRGATAEPTAYGAKLTLEGSGRTLAYSRLRATDATGRELTARMEVLGSAAVPAAPVNASLAGGKRGSDLGLESNWILEGVFDEGVEHDTRGAYAPQLVVVVDDTDAVYPIRIDPTFSDADWVSLNNLPGSDGAVVVMIADSSGNLYVGGDLTAIGTVVANGIAKWDGSTWSALGSGVRETGVYSTVSALALIGTDLYAAGDFSTAGGVTVNGIAKWNGSAWSALGSGMLGGNYPYVADLAVIGTDLYVGGRFTSAGGVAATNIARWDGSAWSALGSGISGAGAYDGVRALAVSGTDLYVGGSFNSAGGVAASHIAKWDGSVWSQVGAGLSEPVTALAVSGTLLYAGGPTRVTRWNGSVWSTLGTGMGVPSSYDPMVAALAVMGTDLYAGGRFTTASGVTVNHIARWNGSGWSALGAGVDGDVGALAVIGSDLYVGGEFITAGGVAAWHIAKWNGGSWSAFGAGMGGGQDLLLVEVRALAVSETNLYIGGHFTTAPGGVPAKNIAKWDGDSWSALGSGVSGYHLDDGVLALAVSGPDLYAGGDFSTAGGVAANYIAKWNGSSWSALGSGVSGGGEWTEVAALASSGTDLYAGGFFTTAGGIPVNSIAKWNGSSWSALGSGTLYTDSTGQVYPGSVYALTVEGTDLYAGGFFTTAGGIPAYGIAKWDGTSWSALGSGMLFDVPTGEVYPGEVYALAVMGTDLYAGGSFTTAGGIPAYGIAKWDGSVWSALDLGTASEPQWQRVYALAASGNDLYAGGSGYLDESTGYPLVAKWDGSQWSALEPGPIGFTHSGVNIDALAADDFGHLFVGGRFVGAGNTVSPHIIEANITGLDFTWDTIASRQEAGVPFAVTLTARNAAGETRSDFTNTVNLSGYAPGFATANLSIGTGTSSWGYPLRTSYHDARTQVICLANELGLACTINSLALEVITPPGQSLENWTIRMKHTSLAEYPASPSWEGTGWIVVYQGNEPAGTTGWRTFEFSTPFGYDGTNNLLVDFSFNNASYSAEGQCRSTDMGTYRSLTYASDSKDGDPLTWSGTSPAPSRSQNVPNIRLVGTYPDLLPVSLSPTVTTQFVNGVWTGEVTVHEVVTNLVLRADDGSGHGGESNPFDVQALAQPPVIATDDGQFGFTSGSFGFNVQGQAGQVVVVEVSTNLVDWLSLQTNTLGSGPFCFSDPETSNFTQRFYRAVTP